MNFFFNIFNRILSHFQYGEQPNPVRDWMALIILSGIALCAIVAWNAWAFDTVANGGTIGTVATSTPSTFTPSSLEAIQKVFTDRATEDAKYQDGTYRFVDPSQ